MLDLIVMQMSKGNREKAIAGNFVVSARDCLISLLDYIVMQTRERATLEAN